MDGVANDLANVFDRVAVVNLARRPERMTRFWEQLGQWPFKRPQRFEAVDGQAVGVPDGWDKGPGAWGCLLSHRQILSRAIADGVGSILVLEDDAVPVANFAQLAGAFMGEVPNDWDGLMLGAGHLLPPQPVSERVVRCAISNRTHAYAARGRFLAALCQMWQNTINDHCDIVLASLMKHFRVYAPQPLLIGQEAGPSDVTGRSEPRRFLGAQPEQKRTPTPFKAAG